ncbi:MAG TPA: hypothetical protein VGE06_03130 [Flavisolibacter sp.]
MKGLLSGKAAVQARRKVALSNLQNMLVTGVRSAQGKPTGEPLTDETRARISGEIATLEGRIKDNEPHRKHIRKKTESNA